MVFIQEVIYWNDGAYEINLDECKPIATHLTALYVNGDNITSFDSFRVKYTPKESKKLIGNKNIIRIMYRIWPNDSITCGYFCFGLIDFMIKGESLLNYTNLSTHNKFEKMTK